MDNDIKFLIETLEEERLRLKNLIATAVKSHEYLLAHYHAEAMEQVSRQLQTLRNLEDRRFDEKQLINRQLKNAEAMLKSEQRERMKHYLENQILKSKQELEQLNLLEKLSVPESKILDQHLELLMAKKIKEVGIVLNKSHGLALKVKRCKTGVKISIPNLKALEKNYTINEDELVRFSGLGFTTNPENQLTLLLTSHRDDLLRKLIVIISIIVFEIFYFKQFEGESFIEIIE